MMGAACPSGCQWSNDAKQEGKWTSPKQSEKQSCQTVDEQSLQLHEIAVLKQHSNLLPSFYENCRFYCIVLMNKTRILIKIRL